MTVRETLTFALLQSNADVSSSDASSALSKLHMDKVNIILEVLGLRECADTMVGGPLLRGISGGQKRLVVEASCNRALFELSFLVLTSLFFVLLSADV